MAFPRVGPVGVKFSPGQSRYYDPLENQTQTTIWNVDLAKR